MIEVSYVKIQNARCPFSNKPVTDLLKPVRAYPCKHIFESHEVEHRQKFGTNICDLDGYKITKIKPVKFVEETINVADLKDDKCPIALEPLNCGQELARALPCGHLFLRSGIGELKWNLKCPLDKIEITKLVDVGLIKKIEKTLTKRVKVQPLHEIKAEVINFLEKHIIVGKNDWLKSKNFREELDKIEISSVELIPNSEFTTKKVSVNGDLINDLWRARYGKKEGPLYYEFRTGNPIWSMTLVLEINIDQNGSTQGVEYSWRAPRSRPHLWIY